MQDNASAIFFSLEQLNTKKKLLSITDVPVILLTALMAFSILSGFCSLFSLSAYNVPVIIVILVASWLMNVVWMWDGRKGLVAKCAATIAPLVAFIALVSYTGSGIALINNAVLSTAGAQARRIFMPYEVVCGLEQYGLCITIVCCIASVWLVIICAHTVIDNNSILAVFITAVQMAGNFLYGNGLSWGIFLVWVVCVIAVSVKCFAGERIYVTEPHSVVAAGIAVVAVFAVVLGFIMLNVAPPDEYERPGVFCTVSENISDKIQAERYGSDSVRSMPSGQFDKVGNLEFSDEVMLSVTARNHESYYLRGFVGGVYTEDGWQPVDGKTLYSGSELFYWMHNSGVFGQNQIAAAAQVLDSKVTEKTVVMDIKTVGADRKYYYTPYETIELRNNNENIMTADILDDAGFTAQGWHGQQEYTVTALGNQVKKYPSLVEVLKEDTPSAVVQEYLKAEKHYNHFVYKTYTALPEDMQELLANHLPEVGKNVTHIKGAVLEYLENEIQYSETIQQRNGNAGFVQDFLEISKSGYSVHYASAAVAMLRFYGIPARYVEGYLITPDMAADAGAGETISVTDRNSHAWVEYYQDGVGWIPFEVTPPYRDIMEQPETLAASGTGGTAGQSSGGGMEMIQDNYEAKEPEKKDDDQQTLPWDKIFSWSMILLAASLLIAVVIRLILRKVKLERLRKQFQLENADDAVINMFDYILELHTVLGIARGNCSVLEYVQPLEEAAGVLSDCYMEIVLVYQKAAYSDKNVTPEERQMMRDYMSEVLKTIKKNSKWSVRFKNRWIKGIY